MPRTKRVSVSSDATNTTVLDLFDKHRELANLPVVENERIVGLISIGDVVKQRLSEMEREHEAMRDYIQTA